MFCILKKKKICLAYVSKHNWNCEKQVILLMISNGEKWHYLAVKKNFSLIKRNNIKKIMVIIIVWIVFILFEQKKTWIA